MLMGLRIKIILVFILVTFVGMSLFGVAAYNGARETSKEKQLLLLHNLNRQLAAGLNPEKPQLLIPPGNKEFKAKEDFYLALLNKDNQIVYEKGQGKLKQAVIRVLPFSLQENRNEGELTHDQNTYVWVSTPLQNHPFTIIHAQLSPGNDLAIFLDAVDTPLALSLVILMWIGVWMSFSISSLISKLSEQKQVLQHKTLHDDLTQLPNRASLITSLEQCIDHRHEKHSIAVFAIDLNHFKEINESLGHQCGDELLCQIGSRLNNILNNAQCIARLGGDEFAVVFDNVKSSSANSLADKITHALEPAFEVQDQSLYISGTLGLALYPEHADDPRLMVQRAEMAMYKAKASHKHLGIYDPKQDKSSIEQASLAHDLRTAIDENQLELYYQPKLDLKTKSIVGVEALTRWHHSSRGTIASDEFILLAEKTGLIRPLTTWVLNHAISQCAQWRRRGIHLNMAVNLSAAGLHDPKLESTISTTLSKHMLPATCLELEITETVMMSDPDQAREVLNRLGALGILITIDDFGTGYSSLAYLKKLPVTNIKIDKSFVSNMLGNSNDDSIVLATIGLAQDLGLKVIAEGVEDQTSQDILETYNCDTAQGMHICAPMPAEQLDKHLAPRKPVAINPGEALPTDYGVTLKNPTELATQ